MSAELSEAQRHLSYWHLHDKKQRVIEAPVPASPLADTHGHLTVFRSIDPAEALVRAAVVGVRLLVVPVDPTEDVPDVPAFFAWWDGVLERARTLLQLLDAEGIASADTQALLEHVYFIAGVHPYGAKRWLEDPSAYARLQLLLNHPRCIGIGEIGLDFGPYHELSAELQLRAFREQLRLAHELELPVELHLRDGEADSLGHDLALQLLRKEGVPQAGCDLHCFTSGPDIMKPFADLGCYIAFGGAATFKRSDDIRAAFLSCPDELLLSETDCPYMAPHPVRGVECEPALVSLTVDFLAEKRQEAGKTTRKHVYELLWRNAQRFFGLEIT